MRTHKKNKWYYSGFRFEMIKSTPREILEDYDLCVKLVREYLENEGRDYNLEDIKESLNLKYNDKYNYRLSQIVAHKKSNLITILEELNLDGKHA